MLEQKKKTCHMKQASKQTSKQVNWQALKIAKDNKCKEYIYIYIQNINEWMNINGWVTGHKAITLNKIRTAHKMTRDAESNEIRCSRYIVWIDYVNEWEREREGERERPLGCNIGFVIYTLACMPSLERQI